MIEWDKLKAMPEAKKTSGVRWDELKAMPEAKKTSGVRWDELKAMPDVSPDELKRLREKPIYANAIRQANERLAMAESAKRPDTQYKIGLDEMWDMDYDGKSTEELLYDLACEKYGIPNDRESYLKRSGKQVLLGNYTDDVTALGTAGQIALGLTGLDAPADVRDLYYDLTHWDWSLGHAGQTLLDGLSLLPGVGAIKYVDEAGEVLQNGLKRLDEAKKLPEVGTKVAQGYIKGGDVPNRRIDTGFGSAKALDDSPNTTEKLTDDEWDAAMGVGEASGEITGGFTGKLWRDDEAAYDNPARPIGADKPTETAGDYFSLVEKAKNVDVWTSAHQAVFYSGEGNRARAEAFARLNGKTTLEITPGGKYFDELNLFGKDSPLTKTQARKIWSILSERYAKSASGNVYGFVKGANPESIFNKVEYPTLEKNPYITNIFTELFN